MSGNNIIILSLILWPKIVLASDFIFVIGESSFSIFLCIIPSLSYIFTFHYSTLHHSTLSSKSLSSSPLFPITIYTFVCFPSLNTFSSISTFIHIVQTIYSFDKGLVIIAELGRSVCDQSHLSGRRFCLPHILTPCLRLQPLIIITFEIANHTANKKSKKTKHKMFTITCFHQLAFHRCRY